MVIHGRRLFVCSLKPEEGSTEGPDPSLLPDPGYLDYGPQSARSALKTPRQRKDIQSELEEHKNSLSPVLCTLAKKKILS